MAPQHDDSDPHPATERGPAAEGNRHKVAGEHQDHGEHGHNHDDGDHRHGGGPLGFVRSLIAPHSHDAANSVDSALESSERGIRAVKISLLALGATALFQLGIVLVIR